MQRLMPLCLVGLGLMLADVLELPAVPTKDRPLGTGVRCVAFSPDGRLLAATFGEPKQRGRVVLWTTATHKLLWSHVEDDGIPAVAFAPDNKTMAIGNYDHSARILDTATGRVLKVLKGHTNYVRAVAFSPDGKTLATGGWDQSIRLWDLPSGEERASLPGPEHIFSLSYSPGGRWLLASDVGLRVLDTVAGKELPDFHKDRGNGAAFIDNHRFVAASEDQTLRLWDITSAEQRVLFKHYVFRLAYSAKARKLAVSSSRRSILLFDFLPRQPTANEKERIDSLLKLFDDDNYETREAAVREMALLGLMAEPALHRAMKESPSVEVRIRARRLREELLEKPQAALRGHTGDVEGLAFSPDGRLLASGGSDGTVRLWNVKELKQVSQLVAP